MHTSYQWLLKICLDCWQDVTVVDIIAIDTTVDHRMITISTKIIMDLERIVVDLLVGTLDSAIHQFGMREESLVLILLLCIS
jgi:hypothetical protein